MRLLTLILVIGAIKLHAITIPIIHNYLLGLPVDEGQLRAFRLMILIPTETDPHKGGELIVIPEHPYRIQEQVKRAASEANDFKAWKAIIDASQDSLPAFTREMAFGLTKWEFREKALERANHDAFKMLRLAYDFAIKVDLDSGNYGDTLPEGIVNDVATILTGNNPLIVVTDLNDPSKIYQVVSVAYQDENGILPLEKRLKIRLPPTGPVRLSQEFHPFVFWRNPARSFPTADAIYNAHPINVGGRAEIKLYVRNPEFPIDWGRLIRRLLISHKITQLNRSAVERSERFPKDFAMKFFDLYGMPRAAASQRGDYWEVMALRQAFWDMGVSQWATREVWLEELVLQAVGPGLSKVYQRYFDFDRELVDVEDPDVKDKARRPKRTKVLATNRSHWEVTAMQQKGWYDPENPLGNPRIQREVFQSPFVENEENCATLLTYEVYMSELMDSHQLQMLYPSRF